MRSRNKTPPVDYFGNVIDIGDRYFYGSPPTFGVVYAIKIKSIEIKTPKRLLDGSSIIMKCKSPDKGVCLDRIPDETN